MGYPYEMKTNKWDMVLGVVFIVCCLVGFLNWLFVSYDVFSGDVEVWSVVKGFLVDGLGVWESGEFNVSCVGVEHFFNNVSFRKDVDGMREVYDFCSDDVGFNDGVVRVPDDLWSCKPSFVCGSYSHAVRCLADLYGVKCGFFKQVGFFGHSGEFVSHIGVYCFVDGEWVRLN